MAIDVTRSRTRRALLGAGLGVIAVGVASALGRPRAAKAADGDAVILGNPNSAANLTEITADVAGLRVISTGGFAIVGNSAADLGVTGYSGAATSYAVFGHALANGTGVWGYSGGPILGALPASPAETGVLGSAAVSKSSIGVRGNSSTGRGALFGGKLAQLRLSPSSAANHPSSGQAGDLFVDKSHRLWFCKGGTTWKQIA